MPIKDAQPRQGRPEPKPIGLVLDDGDWLDLINACDDRVKESRAQSDEWNTKADRNKLMYYAGEDPAPPASKIVFNRIRTEIKTSVNQVTQQPATMKLKPVETNDPGEFYSFDPMMPDPIDPASAQQRQQPQLTGETDSTGQPVLAPGMSLFKLDDKALADFWQRQFDVHFARSKMWPRFRQCAFKAAIAGFMFPVFEWNVASKQAKLWTSISVWDTHTDAVGVDHFEESQFFGVDWLLEASQARQMFPEHADVINEWARAGNPSKGGDVVLGGGKDRRYERNMIILRHMWIRNQPVLMTQDEVVQSGALPTQEVPVGEASYDDMGNPVAPPVQTQLAPDPETGLPPQPIFLDGDEPTINPAWPQRLTIRHVVYLPDIKKGVADEECQYSDIPAAWMPGDPIPDQLFGTGYPESFNSPQMAENRIINAAVKYVEQFPTPGATISDITAEAIAKGLKGHMLNPSDMLIVPQQVVDAAGGIANVIQWNVPPALPPSVPEVLSILRAKTQETAVNPEVTSGKQPGQVTGWQSLQLLQAAAANQYNFPMQWFTECIERIGKLMLDAMVQWLTVEDLMQVCSEYPPHIVEAFQRRARESEWNLDVQLSSTVGLQKAKERSDAVESRNVVSPLTGRPMLSDRTMAERFGEDFDEENRRMDEEMRSPAAQAMAQQQQAEQQQKEEPAGGSGHNGNGFGGRMSGN